MTTWAGFKAGLLTILGDENRLEPTWTDAELLMYVNHALVALSDHTAAEAEVLATSVTAVSTYVLPTDYLALGPVRIIASNHEKLVTPKRREPGQARYSPSTLAGSIYGPDAYFEWKGTLYFHSLVPANAQIAVAYFGYWTPLTVDASVIPTPRWMEEALLWACMRFCMSKPGVQAAQVRQWNQKQDSGTPEDNPALVYAEYCRKQYDRLLANHPTQDRTGWESN